jgi:hypothetical protein
VPPITTIFMGLPFVVGVQLADSCPWRRRGG